MDEFLLAAWHLRYVIFFIVAMIGIATWLTHEARHPMQLDDSDCPTSKQFGDHRRW